MNKGPYNPLDKLSLARSIETEILSRPVQPLSDVRQISGAGVYLIYYVGDFPAYAPIAEGNRDGKYASPIYIGKAIPKGGRKGGLGADASKGNALAVRLGQHAESIDEASNISLDHFYLRYMVIDDVWIPLGENMLIETFKPLWNRAIDGFGNKDPGRRRSKQYKSPWDVLHPGRKFTDKLADSGLHSDLLIQRVEDYIAGRPLAKLPKKVVEQIAEQETEAEEAADEV